MRELASCTRARPTIARGCPRNGLVWSLFSRPTVEPHPRCALRAARGRRSWAHRVRFPFCPESLRAREEKSLAHRITTKPSILRELAATGFRGSMCAREREREKFMSQMGCRGVCDCHGKQGFPAGEGGRHASGFGGISVRMCVCVFVL